MAGIARLCAALAVAVAAAPVAAQKPAPVTAEALVRLSDIAGLRLSPDGTRVAYQVQAADPERNRYAAAWWIAPVDRKGPPVLLADAGTPSFEAAGRTGRLTGIRTTPRAQWSPDGRWVLYPRGNGARTELWRASADGSLQERVDQGEHPVTRFAWSVDGRAILYEVSTAEAEMARLKREEAPRGYLLDSRFDPSFALEPVRGARAATQAFRRDLATARVAPATPEDSARLAAAQAPYVVVFRTPGQSQFFTDWNPLPADAAKSAGKPGARLLVTAGSNIVWAEPLEPALDGPFAPLALKASTAIGTRPPVCAQEACRGRISEIWSTPDRSRIVFTRLEGWANSRQGLYVWNLASGTVRRIFASDDVLADCEVSDVSAVCFHEGPLQPRRIVAISLRSGRMRAVADSNPGWPERACPAEKLLLRDAFGIESYAYYVAPCGAASAGQHPLVVVQYRASGFLRGATGDEYPIQALAAQGIGVLAYEKPTRWDDLSKLALVSEALEWKDFRERRSTWSTIRSAIGALIARGEADPARIAITGLSDGAETAAWALAHGEPFAAAILSTPAWDPIEAHVVGASSRRQFASFGFLPENTEQNAMWRETSMALNADKVKTPILANLADRETIRFLQTVAVFEAKRKPIEVFVHPDEYHQKWQPAHRAAIYTRNIDWLNFWLKGAEDPSPEKAAQYARWRKLRELREPVSGFK